MNKLTTGSAVLIAALAAGHADPVSAAKGRTSNRYARLSGRKRASWSDRKSRRYPESEARKAIKALGVA